MRKITSITSLFLMLFFAQFMFAQTARVQAIHNSPDAAAAEVDVYLNGDLLLDNFAFRNATPFVDVAAGVPISIDVAPANSTSAANSIYNLTTTLAANEKYILIANGIVSETGYSPAQPFALNVFSGAREVANNPAGIDMLVNHGSPDAPTVDVVETSAPAGTIVDNISYPNFIPNYLSLILGDYIVDVRDETGTTTVATYAAPLESLELEGQAITVLASGFLNPANNSNGPAFGLWVASAAGGELIPLPLVGNARVQVIHNSPDLAAAEVDVYLNGDLLLDDFAFRNATPFVDVPAGVEISIDIAPANSTSVANSIYNLTTTLTANETYILIANGIVSETGYSPAQPFGLSVYAGAREVASEVTNVDILVNHGSPDAPTVDVVETSVPAGTIVDDLSFPSFIEDYLELPALDFTLDVRDETGTTTVASYLAPLAFLELEGSAITVIASGFLNPANNSDGPAFGLWVATAAGGPLLPLPLADQTARVQVIHNSPDLAAAEVDVYLNGDLLLDDFAFRTATPFVDVPAGVEISIDIAPANSTSVANSIYNLTTMLTAGETYILIANGIVSETGYSPAQPFGLSVYAGAREVASEVTNVDILVNHGSPDAPTVDVVETSVPAGTIVDDLSFPSFIEDYLELPALDFTLDVRDETGTTTVASYLAPLAFLELEGSAITVIASGFLNPANNSDGPAFGLWVATAAGGDLIPLPTAPLSADEFNKNTLKVFPNPSQGYLNVSLPFELNNVEAQLFDINGRKVLDIQNLREEIALDGVLDGIYLLQVTSNNESFTERIILKR